MWTRAKLMACHIAGFQCHASQEAALSRRNLDISRLLLASAGLRDVYKPDGTTMHCPVLRWNLETALSQWLTFSSPRCPLPVTYNGKPTIPWRLYPVRGHVGSVCPRSDYVYTFLRSSYDCGRSRWEVKAGEWSERTSAEAQRG